MTRSFVRIGFLSCFLCGACRTTNDLHRDQEDPSGVKTVDASTAPSPDKASTSRNQVIEELKSQLAISQGQLEDSQHGFSEEKSKLEKRIAELEEENKKLKDHSTPSLDADHPVIGVQGDLPPGKSGAPLLWELGLRDLKARHFAEARSPFQELVKQYPKDPRMLEALMTLGMIQYENQQFKEAALSWNEAIDRFPKNKNLGLAWLGQGLALARLGQTKDAKLFLDEVSVKYPKTPYALSAKKVLGSASKKGMKVPSSLFSAFPAWLKSLDK